MWRHKSEMVYNNTHAVEEVIDTMERGPNALELKEENERSIFISFY